MKRIRQEVLAPNVDIRVEQITPVVSQIDGRNGESEACSGYPYRLELIRVCVHDRPSGFGFISAALGMDSCIDMAATYGIGMCSIKHSNHFGMSASFVLQAARRGMMSMVFTNSSPAVSTSQCPSSCRSSITTTITSTASGLGWHVTADGGLADRLRCTGR